MFLKDVYCRHVKTRAVFWKGFDLGLQKSIKGCTNCNLQIYKHNNQFTSIIFLTLYQTLTFYSIDTHLRINNRQLLKTLWETKKLLITSNFFLSHKVFYSIRKLYPHLSIFMTSYLYLLLKWKSPKLAYEVKG